MSLSVTPPEHRPNNSAFVGFNYWQSIVLCVTLGSGCFALFSLMLERCRYSVFLSLLIISGLAHELYCAAVLGHFKILVDSNLIFIHRNKCANIFPASLIANGIYLTLILSKAVAIHFKERSKLSRCMLMLFMTTSVLVVLVFNNEDEPNNRPMVINMKEDVKLYFTVCKRPVQYITLSLEYILLYGPIATIFGYILIFRNGIRQRHLCIIDKCPSKDDGPCEKCDYLNKLLQTVLIYYIVSLLLIRPLQMIWNGAREQRTMDIIPSLVNTVMFSYLSLEYILKLRQMKHQS